MRIHSLLLCGTLAAVASLANAQTQQRPVPPAGATALCKDGSHSNLAERKMACEANGGIQTWYGKRGAPAVPALQTQSSSVNATGIAPETSGPSRTPGTQAQPATSTTPEKR